MFDFDELELKADAAAEPTPQADPPKKEQEQPNADAAAEPTPQADPPKKEQEQPNAKYAPGMVLECVGPVLMRQQEDGDLESGQVARLSQNSLVQVLELGRGPSGKRIKLRAATGEEGWASVIASNTAPMFRLSDRVELESPEKESLESKTEKEKVEMPWSSIRAGDWWELSSVIMRKEEDTDSVIVRRLQQGEELEILREGTEPTGKINRSGISLR
eukprot:g4115.t1